MMRPVLVEEPGWTGGVCREQADGAWPNGTRVEKTGYEIGGPAFNSHRIGDQATVLGSFRALDGGLIYCLEWDDRPKWSILAAGKYLAKATRT